MSDNEDEDSSFNWADVYFGDNQSYLGYAIERCSEVLAHESIVDSHPSEIDLDLSSLDFVNVDARYLVESSNQLERMKKLRRGELESDMFLDVTVQASIEDINFEEKLLILIEDDESINIFSSEITETEFFQSDVEGKMELDEGFFKRMDTIETVVASEVQSMLEFLI